MEQKKIFIVRPNDNIGGSQRMAATYCSLLSEMGFDVVMITLTGQGKRCLKNDRSVFLNKARCLYSIMALKKIISDLQPDIILGFQFQAHIVLSILALICPRKKWKYVLRESNLQYYMSHLGLRNVLVNLNYSLADRIIAQCVDMKNHIIRHYGVVNSKIKIIYNFPEYALKPAMVRRNVLMVASTLSKQKNIIEALDLWSCQNFSDELHIYGYDKDRIKELQEYVARHRISKVFFKGLVEVIPYESYRLLLITSLYEGFSNAVLESLSCGTPVLSKNYEGGITEVIVDSNGLIYDNYNAVDISAFASRNWDHSAIKSNLKKVFNKSKFKASCEEVFTF